MKGGKLNLQAGLITYLVSVRDSWVLVAVNAKGTYKVLQAGLWRECMKRTLFILIVLTSTVLWADTVTAAQTVTTATGGPIRTELGYGIAVNKESSLQREWITIHDDSLPIELAGTIGVKTIYESGGQYSNGDYLYVAHYKMTPKQPVSAVEVRFLTFDIWGNHSRNLTATNIIDLDSGKMKTFDSKWNVFSENEVSEYYASIAYIAQVRTKDGQVIKADPRFVLEQARKFSKKFSLDDLEPKPEK